MAETEKLKLPKIDNNMTADVVRDFNALAEKIDETVASQEDVENIEVPVTSVNNKTGDVILNASDVGAETPQGAQDKVDNHANKTDNPHNVTKKQVGLDNVKNVEQASKVDHDQLAQDVGDNATNIASNATEISNTKQSLSEHQADIASQDKLGHIKVDGDTIKIDNSGVISSEGSFDSRSVYVELGENAKAKGTDSIAIGHNSSTSEYIGQISIGVNAYSATNAISIGKDSKAEGLSSVSLGMQARTVKDSVGLGSQAYADGKNSLSLGPNTDAIEDFSVAIGSGSTSSNKGEGVLGGDNEYRTNKWKVPGDFTVEGSKDFEIAHPNPDKRDTHRLRHGAVESPTAGDTLNRFKVKATKDNDTQIINLPDYFTHLNTDVQIFITPQGHFGQGYGVYDETNENIEIHCQLEGEYNVLVIGTRNDEAVRNNGKTQIEREIGRSWTGESYNFSVDEIMEVEEIKEVS